MGAEVRGTNYYFFCFADIEVKVIVTHTPLSEMCYSIVIVQSGVVTCENRKNGCVVLFEVHGGR